MSLRSLWQGWKRRAKELRLEAHALLLAYRDPRVPWYAKAFAALVVAYAFSPIDLIPDFIPVLGQLDDLLLIPAGVLLAVKMIPKAVLAECRAKARDALDKKKPRMWASAVIAGAIWLALVAAVAWLVAKVV